jgi:beta-glucanase (GH16 family)
LFLTDCPPNPALGTSVNLDLTKEADATAFFDNLSGTAITHGTDGAVFSIASENQAPTWASKKFIFGGKVECSVKAAPGPGIVTSVVLLSKDLDEIDFEWVGGDNAQVQTNYFGKGDTTTYDRGAYHAVTNPTGQFHTYTIDWTKASVKWSIDGALVRTLNYADAKGGATFPQTPMQVKLGSWVAGKASAGEGTITWSGGLANFANGPFLAYYKSCTITDYSTGAKQYVFGDRTGSWDSIKIDTTGANTTDSTTTSKPSGSSTAAPKTTLSTSKNGSAGGATTTGATGTGGSNSPAATTTGPPTTTPNAAPNAVVNWGVVAAGLFIAKFFL